MRAAIYEAFEGPIAVRDLPDPAPAPDAAIVRVEAAGIGRSDWQGWMGQHPAIRPPHIPGHEVAGVVEAVGTHVTEWFTGDRVIVPFTGGCGRCAHCRQGDHQICDHPFQLGLTHWGAFAERVSVRYADVNLVRVPQGVDFVTAAILGGRFAAAYRAVVSRGRISPGEWLAVHGCGGLGLAAIMVANAVGARVVGIDITKEHLNKARSVGARAVIDASKVNDVVQAVRDITHGGAHLAIDALGSPATCCNALAGLRKRGRHVQVGCIPTDQHQMPLPMDQIMANELSLLGGHGMPAHAYPEMLAMIAAGRLQPGHLVTRTVDLEQSIHELQSMNRFEGVGITVIDRF